MADSALTSLPAVTRPLADAPALSGFTAASPLPAAIAASGTTIGQSPSTLVDLQWFSPDATGTTEVTTEIQDALDMAATAGLPIVIRSGTYLTGQIAPPSNSVIHFEPGAILKAKDGLEESTPNFEALIRLEEVSNVTIYGNGATLSFNDKSSYSGEHNHALMINGSTDIRVYDLNCNDSGGDGIYVGGYNTTLAHSERIYLERVTCDNNRRQGLSIIGVSGFRATDCTFSGTTGTAPECGVDIEPEAYSTALDNIVFTRCTFSDNAVAGVLVFLVKSAVRVDVTFRDCIMPDNYHGVQAVYLHSGTEGRVRFVNCETQRSQRAGWLLAGNHPDGCTIEIRDGFSLSDNTDSATNASDAGGAALYIREGIRTDSPSSDAGEGGVIGGVTIDGFHWVSDSGTIQSGIRVGRTFATALTVRDVAMRRFGGTGHTVQPTQIGSPFGSPQIDDAYDNVVVEPDAEQVIAYTASATIASRYVGYTITNEGAAGATAMTLRDPGGPGVTIHFRLEEDQVMKVRAQSGAVVYPAGHGTENEIQAERKGCSCTVVSDADGNWRVARSVGSWSPLTLDGKLGLFGAAPIAQPTVVAYPAGGATQDAEARAAITSTILRERNLGTQASS